MSKSVYVGLGSKWYNHYEVCKIGKKWRVVWKGQTTYDLSQAHYDTFAEALAFSLELYAKTIYDIGDPDTVENIRKELKGKKLYAIAGRAYHAEVLHRIANS